MSTTEFLQKITKTLQMINDYMELNCYGYHVLAFSFQENFFKVTIQEYMTTPYDLTVKEDGRIYNSTDCDCIKTMESAYDDEEMIKSIKDFKEKWYS